MAKIDELLKLMIDSSASDMHLTTGSHPYMRIHGIMQPITKFNVLTNSSSQALIFEILSDKQKKSFITNWELDLAYAIPNLSRFRVNVFMQRKGLGAVFRAIPEKILTAKELGLPKPIIELSDAHKGLVIVTGPTGSGKSTTLAAIVDHVNKTRSQHIITIEDPIEFVHTNQNCLVNQREIGSHSKSFSNALRAALREDPDIILVGEMRDLETIALAITAAETGHLVFGTLHTNNAPKTIDRIIDAFPQNQQNQIRSMLAESLRGVVAQSLFTRKDQQGRIAAFEILRNTKAIANLIREAKTHQIPSMLQTGSRLGMVPYEKSVGILVQNNLIHKKDADVFLGKYED